MTLNFTIPPFIKKAALSLLTMALVTTANAQIDYTVGNGTVNGGTTGVPTPFEDFYDGDKHQFLFRVADLNAAGMFGPGVITAIKWNVVNKNNYNNVPDFAITIGSTTQNDMATGYVAGVNTPVFSAGTNNVTNGIMTYTLPTPFVWNGTDNIVIQTCHGNTSTRPCYNYTQCAAVNYTSTSYASTRYQRSDCAGNLCASTGGSTLSSRPNTIFTFGLPCADTPKTSISGPTKVCPMVPFSLRPDSFYSQATFKWEYSNNGTSFSNFTGVPNIFGEIKDSISSPRWYRLTVTCDSNKSFTWTTPIHKVDIAPFYYCYCNSSSVSDAGADIGNLTIINTNKFDTVYGKKILVTGTGLPVYSNSLSKGKYTPYHDSLAWPCLYRDTNYIFNVTQIHSGSTFETGVLQAYIDYNRDGLYNPVTERVFVKALDGTGTTPHIAQMSVTVPSTAQVGPTGLRVIISKDTVKAAPCDTLSGGGEVEDYIVDICYRPCDGPVNAGMVVSTDTSMCNGYEYTLTDTTYEKTRSGFTRSWQISGDNQVWQNINNSMGKDTLERIFGGQPLHYRLRTICLPTHDTNYSQSTLINVKPGYKCYCYSKAIGGKNMDTSDIGGVSIAAYSNNAGGPHLLNPVAMYPRTDYTDIDPIEMFTDSVYKFYVYHTMPVGEHGDAKVTIFMDFNNNHEYDIPEERIYTGFTTIGNHTLVDNVIIPVNAISDVPTGMRVIVNNNVGPNIPSDEACGSYTSGETEDYLLVFRKKWGVNVKDVLALNNFMVHPNPTTGRFTVQFNSQSEINKVSIRVTTVTGQLVQEQAYSHNGGVFSKELDMSGQASGVYFVELHSDGEKQMKKLILQ